MSSAGTSKTTTLQYVFRQAGKEERAHSVTLWHPEMTLVAPIRSNLPAWTRLNHHQCTHCPLRADAHPHCPIAANLVDLVELFRDGVSYDQCEVRIRSEIREYYKVVPLQLGISSLMGLVMVTSGCPVMDNLRPMVYTHLPFATVEETVYRAISMYLFAQYFRSRRGLEPDLSLEGLVRIYEDVALVNKCFTQRLLSLNTKDASLNALMTLDCFGTLTSMSIMEAELEPLERLFSAYLKDDPS